MSGKFPVHLHLGIYINPQGKEELSVNPYYVLQAMEKKVKNTLIDNKFFEIYAIMIKHMGRHT